MRRSFLNILFGLALLVLLLLGLFSYLFTSKLIQANKWVIHTYQVIGAADTSLFHLVDAEANQRGYIIVGEDIYLSLYSDSLTELKKRIVELERLTHDNPVQLQRVITLKELINKRIGVFEKVINTYKKESSQAALKLIATGEGTLITQQIKRQFQEIETEELILLKKRNQDLLANSAQTHALIIGGSVFNSILFLIAFWLLNRQLNARRKAEVEVENSQSRIKGIIEGSSDLIGAIDTEYRFITFNTGYQRAFKRIYGRLINIGLTIQEAFSNNNKNLEGIMAAWKKALRGEDFSVTEEFEYEGNKSFYEVVYSGIRNEKGNLIGAAQTLHDITDRIEHQRKLEKSNTQLEKTLTHLKRYNNEINLLTEMSRALQSCLTIHEAYEPITIFCQQILLNTAGILYIMHPSRNYLEAVATWGDPAVKEQVFSPDQCWGLRRGQPYYADRSGKKLVCKHLKLEGNITIPRYICVPLIAQNDTLGLLYLEIKNNVEIKNDNEAINNFHALILTTAEQISLAIANIRLRETLRYQSIRDPLTGLFNRRYLEELLSREIERAERKNTPLAFIMIDVDHFKRFNDKYGHEAGDVVLREVGYLLRENFRGSDIACRFGGEEFLLFLYDTTAEVAKERAEDLRQKVHKIQVKYGKDILEKISISQGISTFPQDGNNSEELIAAADHALYRAKNEGRDRVEVYNKAK